MNAFDRKPKKPLQRNGSMEQRKQGEVGRMTENEYSYLMTKYLASDYCEAMSFFEYATRYGRQLIKNRSENDGRCEVDQDHH